MITVENIDGRLLIPTDLMAGTSVERLLGERKVNITVQDTSHAGNGDSDVVCEAGDRSLFPASFMAGTNVKRLHRVRRVERI